MAFWIIALVMSVLVAGTLVMAVLRPRRSGAGTDSDLALYRDQLREVDRDLARGVLSTEDAGQVRIEISRRLLDADRRQMSDPLPSGQADVAFAAVLGLAVLAAAGLLYWQLGAPAYPDEPIANRLAAADTYFRTRPSQTVVETRLGVPRVDPNIPQDQLDLTQKLRDALKSRLDDMTGFVLLAQSEAQLGNFPAAARAQAEVLRIKGKLSTATDYADYADLLVLAAAGYVSPEAEQALAQALDKDPRNGVALYYVGLMYAQTGRPDRTMQFWQPLLERSAPDDPWVAPIEAEIETVAAEAGIRYTLPDHPGPSAADVAGAAKMPADQRQAMIESMVARLSDRLATDGGPPEDWARLITSLAVLERTDEAQRIWQAAQNAYAGDETAQSVLDQAAAQAGLTQ